MTNGSEIDVTYNIAFDTTLFLLIILFIAIVFVVIGLRLPLFFILAWFVAWYGGYLALGSTTEGMMIVTYFLLGIFALISFGLQMLGEGRTG